MKDWSKASLAEIVEHLEKHHLGLKEKLLEISRILEQISAGSGKKCGNIVESLQDFFAGFGPEMEKHFDREERILWPYIRQMEDFSQTGSNRPDFHYGSIKNPISLIEYEHDRIENVMLDIMRTLAGDYKLPPDTDDDFSRLYDCLRNIEKEIREHIYLENKILFPQVIELELQTMHSR
ncbi:MAG TPA: hypothetical protein DDW84_05880 [Phycisphaerales bacterium]|nr:MAG: hypothetical protein A2Y13_04615 [Planctomycetes bacterium GWC2_45_44]HBG78362.1 hypothetical protein [Phycisphaerales bacterium]HBR20666.1 hypothetical protein [Phycisphaerales bacterium]